MMMMMFIIFLQREVDTPGEDDTSCNKKSLFSRFIPIIMIVLFFLFSSSNS